MARVSMILLRIFSILFLLSLVPEKSNSLAGNINENSGGLYFPIDLISDAVVRVTNGEKVFEKMAEIYISSGKCEYAQAIYAVLNLISYNEKYSYALGTCYWEEDKDAAIKHFLIADQELSEAISFEIAVELEKKGVWESLDIQAFYEMTPKLDSAKSYYALAQFTQNSNEKIAQLSRAESLGLDEARMSLGYIFYYGLGDKEKDLKQALMFFQGIKEKDGKVWLMIGQTYLALNRKKQAFESFVEAEKSGNLDGKENVGICYLNGWGVAQSYSLAVAKFEELLSEKNNMTIESSPLENLKFQADNIKYYVELLVNNNDFADPLSSKSKRSVLEMQRKMLKSNVKKNTKVSSKIDEVFPNFIETLENVELLVKYSLFSLSQNDCLSMSQLRVLSGSSDKSLVGNTLYLDETFLLQKRNENDFKVEVIGGLAYQFALMLQNKGNKSSPENWQRSLAEKVTISLGYKLIGKTEKQGDSLSFSANFLIWLDQKFHSVPSISQKINGHLGTHGWDIEQFQNLTGKSIQTLWIEFLNEVKI